MRDVLRRVWALAALSVVELFRRKDVYVAVILGGAIVAPLATVNLFGVEGIVRYLREVTLLLTWVFGLAITVATAARQLTLELERKTVYALLAKPVSVAEVVAGKFLGAVAASASCLALFYLLLLLLCGLKEGTWWPAGVGQAFVLHVAFVALLTAWTLAGSLVLSPGANLTVGFLLGAGMLLFGERLGRLAQEAGGVAGAVLWSLHLLLPHLEFYDLRLRVIHGWGGLPAGVVAVLLLYAALYTTGLLTLTGWLLRRKLR